MKLRGLSVMLLACVLAFCLVACGDDNGDSTESRCKSACARWFECEDDLAEAFGLTKEQLRANTYKNQGECTSECVQDVEDAEEGEDVDECFNCFAKSSCDAVVACFAEKCT